MNICNDITTYLMFFENIQIKMHADVESVIVSYIMKGMKLYIID